jgi:RNA polymerase sigma factor (TIGR02999 family)
MRSSTPNSTWNPWPGAEFMSDSTYRRLCLRAKALLRREPSDHRLEPADLLHEALLRIDKSHTPVHLHDESHLLALATLVMRRILVDRTRAVDLHLRLRCVPLEPAMAFSKDPNPEAEPLHDALHYMQNSEARLYCIVQMRFFLGLETKEIAKALSISSRTVKRDWQAARGWLRRELVRHDNAPLRCAHAPLPAQGRSEGRQ